MPEEEPTPIDMSAKHEAIQAALVKLRQNPTAMRGVLQTYGIIDDPKPYARPQPSEWDDDYGWLDEEE